MGLPAAQVRVLVAHERDRLELVEYRIDSIPSERARSFWIANSSATPP